MAIGLQKVSFHSNPKERQCQECSSYHSIVLISHASKVKLKILQARLQQYVDWEIPDVQAGFRKGRGTRGQIANIYWITGKERELQTNTYFCFTDYAKAFVWITTNCGKFLEVGIPAHLTCLLRNLYTDKKQQLEPDMEQRTGSNLGKQYIKAVYCHPAYLTSLQSTSFKMPGWMNHKLEQDCWEEYQQSHICRWYYSTGRR